MSVSAFCNDKVLVLKRVLHQTLPLADHIAIFYSVSHALFIDLLCWYKYRFLAKISSFRGDRSCCVASICDCINWVWTFFRFAYLCCVSSTKVVVGMEMLFSYLLCIFLLTHYLPVCSVCLQHVHDWMVKVTRHGCVLIVTNELMCSWSINNHTHVRHKQTILKTRNFLPKHKL